MDPKRMQELAGLSKSSRGNRAGKKRRFVAIILAGVVAGLIGGFVLYDPPPAERRAVTVELDARPLRLRAEGS